MMSADLLILLSDVSGLYSAPPDANPDAELIETVERVTPAIEAMAGAAGSGLSRGGMRTKVDAGKIATAGGATMIIASGRADSPIRRISAGEACTWFLADANPVAARKRWISGRLETRGAVVVDIGAVKALRAGKSLLPAGVRRVEGAFQRGDAVEIRSLTGEEIGRGLVAYDHADAERIAGRNSREIETILGFAGRAEMIHRDDMALRGE
jgi:glutamate 5-kinase